ncbi:MAG: amidohydrolase family protein, partial [Promethearchaeota archaeon]
LGGVDTIEHGAEIPDDLVDLFKDNPKSLRGYTALIPTISAAMGLATLPIKLTKITKVKKENAKIIETRMIKGFQKAYKSGIKIGCGTDSSVTFCPHYDVWKELKYYLKYSDMSSKEAIYIATKCTAEILGIEDITGSIEVGKSADLIVVMKNPLDNIEVLKQVNKVIIRGYLIDKPKVKKIKIIEKNPINVPIEII